jgi:AraC family transcriptional regulator
MHPRFETLPEKKLVGKRRRMSLSKDLTFELWRSFMPERRKITNAMGTDLFSMQVYDRDFDFMNFDPEAYFEKWAAMEVTEFDNIPDGMEPFVLKGGLYAVFVHKGPASKGEMTFRYIFGVWLPDSDYKIDDRPHFEILGEKYKHDDPVSEEEIWIPVTRKETGDL